MWGQWRGFEATWRSAVTVLALAGLMVGCASTDSAERYRSAHYRPDDGGRKPWRWASAVSRMSSWIN